ncbi:cytochrome c biogenesis protein CcdA [Candidatus Microgenomates bacterium]|nr:MAG: cytochrome c biogenesis protein CcdA [Candidatus Microgenomates bacterium]
MQIVSIPVVFAAGVVSFFAPCVLPLLPAYIAYVLGSNTSESFKKSIITSAFYVSGFTLVFVLLGAAAGGVGLLLRRNTLLVQQLGGLLVIMFGIEYSGLYNFRFLAKQRKLKLPVWIERLGPLRAFVIGIVFAITWSPCVGPVLGSVLALAAVSTTAYAGALLLFVYSLGISIPFLLISVALNHAPERLKIVKKHIGTITKISGIVMIIIGLLLLTGTYKYLSGWINQLFF